MEAYASHGPVGPPRRLRLLPGPAGPQPLPSRELGPYGLLYKVKIPRADQPTKPTAGLGTL